MIFKIISSKNSIEYVYKNAYEISSLSQFFTKLEVLYSRLYCIVVVNYILDQVHNKVIRNSFSLQFSCTLQLLQYYQSTRILLQWVESIRSGHCFHCCLGCSWQNFSSFLERKNLLLQRLNRATEPNKGRIGLAILDINIYYMGGQNCILFEP